MTDLSLLTWKEIKEIDKEKSVAFAVMAPLEEHGWHLPLGTDVIEGEFWSRKAMEHIEEQLRVECCYLPSFPVAAASVNEFYGSVHFTMRTTCDVAAGILESLRCMGFRNIVLIASHADPQHQIAVEKAVRRINRRYGTCAFAPMGQIFMGKGVRMPAELSDFEKAHPDDFHAGWVETSSLLAMDGGYVREGYKEMPDSTITEKEMISRRTQVKGMGKYGYLGSPRHASRELGIQLNENCIASITDAVVKFYRRDGYQEYGRYALYKILPLHLGFLGMFGRVRRMEAE